MNQKFLLCFHDFSVWNYRTVTPILYELKELAGGPFSILVIPDTANAETETIEEFKQSLKQLQEDGFEIALHGFRHKATKSCRSPLGSLQLKLTNNEAEFAGLCRKQSQHLLDQGFCAWNRLFNEGNAQGQRFYPAAFVPPTWYSNPYLAGQVRRNHLLFESRWSLSPVIGRSVFSPVVSFAGIPHILEKPAFLFGTLMLKQPFGLPRIALHPCDFPRLKTPIFKLVQQASATCKLSLYRDI